jgi:flagellar protein FliO/FliZ
MLTRHKHLLRASLTAASFLAPVFASAADRLGTEGRALSESGVAGNLIQTTLGLMLILGLIFGAAWFAKRFGNLKVGAQGRIKIIGGVSLGGRERVVLLEVGAQQLLVGVAPGAIQTLHVLEQPLQAEVKPTMPGGFAEKLAAAIRTPRK